MFARLAELKSEVVRLENLANLSRTRKGKKRVDISRDDYLDLCKMANVEPGIDGASQVVTLTGQAYSALAATAVERRVEAALS